MNTELTWLTELAFNQDGLIPAIAQDAQTGVVLMMAWMNAEAVTETVRTGHAVYYSRSRQRLWRKGEESGHIQIIHEIRLDCDADVLLLQVTQQGGIACHTGRAHCFFRRLDHASDQTHWTTVDPVLKDPTDIYTSSKP
ncbi:phosphoribosyl-AMP cyclohydrolase [Alcaligenaceae bacterium CGII-47]|nr:phosphoribosyl-AMP cyclohydrolase [Alcaligenaceae bacterium CGII-47]